MSSTSRCSNSGKRPAAGVLSADGGASRALRSVLTSALRSVVARPSAYSLFRRPDRPAICLSIEMDTGARALAFPAQERHLQVTCKPSFSIAYSGMVEASCKSARVKN